MRWEYFVNPFPGWAERRIRACLCDPRDWPMVVLTSNIFCSTVVAACLLYSLPLGCAAAHWCGLAYVVLTTALFDGRFILCLHYSSHLKLWSAAKLGDLRAGLLNEVLPSLLGPLFGIPPGMYFLHHVAMHHVEDNAFPGDLSSTQPYQRDSILDFVKARTPRGLAWRAAFALGSPDFPPNLHAPRPRAVLGDLLEHERRLPAALRAGQGAAAPGRLLALPALRLRPPHPRRMGRLARRRALDARCALRQVVAHAHVRQLVAAHLCRPRAPLRRLRLHVQLPGRVRQPLHVQRRLPHCAPRQRAQALERDARRVRAVAACAREARRALL